MHETVQLKTSDGHQLDAYVAKPVGEPIAGLVVVQEIFGVNHHIRSVADGYAQDGFFVVAPALFDRVQRGVELGYAPADIKRAMEIYKQLDINNAVLDVGAAVEYARQQTGKKVGVIGYCFGGTVAWLSATRLPIDAAVTYYGGGVGNFANETQPAPAMMHFGRQDTHIPESEVRRVQDAHPDVQVYWYDAGHAFNCEPRESYEPKSAALARSRSLEFLKQKLAA